MPAGEPIENGDHELSLGSETLSRRVALRRAFGFAVAAPAVLTLLQACGGDDDEDPTPTPEPEETEPADETPVVDETAEPADETPVVDIDASPVSNGGGGTTSDPLPDPPNLGG